ncbi:MAG: GNAT family N-acetyltransferase, partial [Bacilli bacterium]|nr:GNAT family N-acetyltransferase [Bacilli bacterium]
LYHLYLASFEDSRDYVDFFFLHYYHPERAFGVQRDGTIVSALHIIMKQMIYNNKIIDMPFIVAASTDQKYRRQGLMREVMAKTFQALIAEGQTIVSLYPVNPDFYRDYGFVQYTFTRDINSYAKSFECGLEQTSDAALLASMYDKCISEYEGYVVRDEQYYTRYMNSLWQDGYVFELIKKAGEVVGYLVRKDEDISEILLCGEEKPMHKDLDTTDTFMPHPDGDIPSNMIRVLNVEKLLLSMSFDRDTSFDLRLKITDIFVNTNNLVLDLSVQSGRLVLSRCDNYDFEVSIEALTEALFTGRGDDRLAFLFPHKKMVCFDKF